MSEPGAEEACRLTEARRLVAEAAVAETAYRLASVKVAVYEFLHHYGHSELATFKVAIDLAVSLRKIIDGTDEEEPA